jgi:hypothetical protein
MVYLFLCHDIAEIIKHQSIIIYFCSYSQQLVQGKVQTVPGGDGATVATAQQNLRALDALTCVASEKQVSINNRMHLMFYISFAMAN